MLYRELTVDTCNVLLVGVTKAAEDRCHSSLHGSSMDMACGDLSWKGVLGRQGELSDALLLIPVIQEQGPLVPGVFGPGTVPGQLVRLQRGQ